ncbi:MAG: S41 family peptidase [Lachnospiraceae bacterium]|nr:S41 family peptidase [Lachnospiraceae bacterium]
MEENVKKQMKKAQRKGMVQGLLITLSIVIISGVIIGALSFFKKIANESIYAEVLGNTSDSVLDKECVDKLNNLYVLIEKTYIKPVDKEKLQEGLYKGMLQGLEDPYSIYYNKEEFAEMMENDSGTFEGIGAYLDQDPDTKQINVVRPIEGSPAEAAGMKENDIIVEVDGEDITGQDIDVVVSKLRGPKGTTVNVGVKRGGTDEIIHFDIKRDKINSISVDHKMLEGDIGYIAISDFADATADQFMEAFSDLETKGMKSLIIDLRSNGGGYVDISVEIADRLVKEGVIVSVKEKHGLSYKYEDKGDDKYLKVPCVVLVNGNTASASEILTGALRDYKLATVMGTKTFGKGITQMIFPLDDGSGVKITNSEYYTPNGENVHGTGIEPDVVVEWDYEKYTKDGTDNQLEAAEEYLKKQ